jgi:hypothetical protein
MMWVLVRLDRPFSRLANPDPLPTFGLTLLSEIVFCFDSPNGCATEGEREVRGPGGKSMED